MRKTLSSIVAGLAIGLGAASLPRDISATTSECGNISGQWMGSSYVTSRSEFSAGVEGYYQNSDKIGCNGYSAARAVVSNNTDKPIRVFLDWNLNACYSSMSDCEYIASKQEVIEVSPRSVSKGETVMIPRNQNKNPQYPFNYRGQIRRASTSPQDTGVSEITFPNSRTGSQSQEGPRSEFNDPSGITRIQNDNQQNATQSFDGRYHYFVNSCAENYLVGKGSVKGKGEYFLFNPEKPESKPAAKNACESAARKHDAGLDPNFAPNRFFHSELRQNCHCWEGSGRSLPSEFVEGCSH